jgi:hypothetical protein
VLGKLASRSLIFCSCDDSRYLFHHHGRLIVLKDAPIPAIEGDFRCADHLLNNPVASNGNLASIVKGSSSQLQTRLRQDAVGLEQTPKPA